MAAGGFLERWAHDEQLLVEQGNDLEIVFRDGQRNKRQVKPPFVQTGNHLFRYPDGNADLGMREPAAQLPGRPAELVDERGDAGREMKRTRVLGDVILNSCWMWPISLTSSLARSARREAARGGNR